MSNIYQIKQELISIFNEIEDNEGEITPELEDKLNITQESFKDKIKDYTNVVKMLQNDIIDIKAEKARLNDLQKSKEKTIERLKTIIIEAIQEFGDVSKSGGKFVDYGTGKVSIRNTESVEVNEDSINRFVNRYLAGLKWYELQGQLDKSIISPDIILDYANSLTQQEEEEGSSISKFNWYDLDNLNTNIEVNISLADLLDSIHGFELAKALTIYGDFKINAKADKIAIKQNAKENHNMPVYATLVQNKSITIK